MGYISKDIAVISEPKIVALSALPNFVQFSSKPSAKTLLELNVQINAVPTTPVNRTVLNITSIAGELHSFRGTADPVEAGGNVFYISEETSDTAENLRQAMLTDAWIKANFEVVTPFLWAGGSPVNGSVLNIKSKGAGSEFQITVVAPNNIGNSAYLISWVNATTVNNDSISGEASTAEIEIDLYTNPDVFLGEDDRPVTTAKIGTYLTTLSKTYAGAPLWFELNALFSQYPTYNLPPALDWGDTGTVSVYRFIAKVKAVNSFSFYQSNALYVVTGYGRATDEIDLDNYVYSTGTVKLLTNKPTTPYIKGQKEYLNFIFKDVQRGIPAPVEFELGIHYRAYTTAGDFLGSLTAQQRSRGLLNMANTCALNIDAILDAYPNAGRVKVGLSRGAAIVSNDLEYIILPECLHKLNQFTFLNRLGGWDAFNADAESISEIKPTSSTYNKTLTPNHTKGEGVEMVYATSLNVPFTLECAPVSDDVAEWLKEMAAARVVLNNEGEYIIVEDFELKPDPKNKNMHVPKIKYRLSENYTND